MNPRRERSVAEHSAPVFQALADPTRLRLVSSLSERGPQSITGLTRGTRLTRQAITKHLRVLAGAGLVRGERLGRESRWELEPEGLEAARQYLEMVSERWDEALGRLRTLVEE